MSKRQDAPRGLPEDFSPLTETERDLIFIAIPAHAGNNVTMFQAETLIAGLHIPAMPLIGADGKERRGYPIELPEDARKGFVRSVLIRAIYRGEIYNADTWCEVLAADGVGHEDKKTGEIRPISDELFRAEWIDLQAQTLIPLVSRANDGEKTGFGCARSRKQIREHQGQLRQRAAKQQRQHDVGIEIVGAEDGWFNASREISSIAKRWDQERVLMILSELEKMPHTNGQIALMLATGETIASLEGRDLEAEGRQEELDRARSLTGSPIRELIAELRLAGVPVVGRGNLGYSIAADRQDYKTYLGHEHSFVDTDGNETVMHQGLQGRIEAISEHADRMETIAKLWKPADDQERAEAQQALAGSPKPLPLSAVARERRRLRKEAAKDQRETAAREDAGIWLGQARDFLNKWENEYRAADQRIADYAITGGSTTAPTREDRLLKRKWLNARKVLTMRVPRKVKIKAKEIPAPWEYDPAEKAATTKTGGIKTASAGDLHKRAKKKNDDVEPCPW